MNSSEENKNPEKNKILFIHTGGLGDIIFLSPVLKVLVNNLGQTHKIDLLLEKRALNGSSEILPFVNEIKVFDFKNKWALLQIIQLIKLIQNYSIIISSGSSPLVSILLFLSGAKKRIGYKSKLSFLLTDSVALNKKQYASFILADLIEPLCSNFNKAEIIPNFTLPEKPDLLSNLGLESGKYFLIHPGVSQLGIQKGIIKSPNLNYWIELIKLLCEKFTHQKIVLIGGADEKSLIEQIDSQISNSNFLNLGFQKFTLSELTQLIKYSHNFICVDSAPLHLGIACKAKIIALFGPTDPLKLTPPKQENLQIIQVPNLLCQPCLWDKRLKVCSQPVCTQMQIPHAVLKAISAFF